MILLKLTRARPSITMLARRNVYPGEHIQQFEDKTAVDKFLNDATVKEHIALKILTVEPIEKAPKDILIVSSEEKTPNINIKKSEVKTKKE